MLELITIFLQLAGALVAMALLALIWRRPWLGAAAMMVLTPLKSLPGNQGTWTLAKALGAATLAAILGRMVKERTRLHGTHCEIALALVLLALMVSLRDTPFEQYEWTFAFSYVSLWLMTLGVLNAAAQPREYQYLGMTIILMAVLPTITALLQGLWGIELFGEALRVYWGDRLRGTYTGPNGLAVLLGIAVTYGMGLLASMGRAWSLAGRVSLVMLMGAMCWVAYMTYSRAVLFSLIVGGGYVVCSYPFAKRAWDRLDLRRPIWIFLFCLLVLLGSFVVGSSPRWQDRWTKLEGLLGEDTLVDQARLNDMLFISRALLDRPQTVWFGMGLGNYRAMARRTQTSDFHLSGVPHNIVLHFFVMGGMVGLGTLVLTLWQVWKHGRYEADVAQRAPPMVRAHWFAAWASLYACVPLLIFYGGAMANEIWLIAGMALLGKRIAKSCAQDRCRMMAP